MVPAGYIAPVLIAKNILKRESGACSYQRRLPKDRKKHYPHAKGPFIGQSLETKDPALCGEALFRRRGACGKDARTNIFSKRF
jgi:hypothetical protein